MSSTRAYLELLRPANVATALADVVAGFAVAGPGAPVAALPWLLASTACLYAGGIVLNDFFDRKVDAVERPERPIPSGRVSGGRAAAIGFALLAAGLAGGHAVNHEAGPVSAAIVAAVLLYDAWGKRQALFGPVNMGLCRGLNLGLGMAAVPGAIGVHWPLMLIPVAYIAAVTAVSRGEVSGGRQVVAAGSLAVVVAVIVALAGVALSGRQADAGNTISVAAGLGLTALLGWRVLPPLSRAIKTPTAPVIRGAVRAGVLSLVLVDAVIAAAYADMIYSLAVLLTALVAGWLSRQFAVT